MVQKRLEEKMEALEQELSTIRVGKKLPAIEKNLAIGILSQKH